MNISQMMKLKGDWDTFSQNHPQFVKFLNYMSQTKIDEGTVFTLNVKLPDDEKEIKTNLKETESDLELLETLKVKKKKKK